MAGGIINKELDAFAKILKSFDKHVIRAPIIPFVCPISIFIPLAFSLNSPVPAEIRPLFFLFHTLQN